MVFCDIITIVSIVSTNLSSYYTTQTILFESVLSKSILEADSACVISRRVPVSANRFLLLSVYVCDASLCCAANSMVMVLKLN